MKGKNIDHYGKCPVCKTSWDDGPILDVFLEQKKKGHWKKETEEDIKKYIEECYSPPYRFSKLIGIEDLVQDKIVKYMCPECECEFQTK